MGISGIGAGASYSTLKTFQQLNRDVHTQGVEQASRISREAGDYSRVSNFGNETKLGSSKFQQAVKAASEQGQRNVSESMEKAASYTKVSNFGTETKLGSSKFQQANAQVSAKFAAVASAYKQAASLGNASAARGQAVDIGA